MELLNDDYYPLLGHPNAISDYPTLGCSYELGDFDIDTSLDYPLLGIYTAETRELRLKKYRETRRMLYKKPRTKKKYDMEKKVRLKGRFVK